MSKGQEKVFYKRKKNSTFQKTYLENTELQNSVNEGHFVICNKILKSLVYVKTLVN